ncbi:hypothetical protein Purlil1_10857 [Purpureocillium lilacinum]|uniref:non-specific serine/threonine protein kinase n=1 Tax=Purpureocillium lilacinum TaxID=33203 RepID=A0ABR0BLH0_PURLI|nr:hypothetical protein Purlil1_10857 [Purpureocillium lilacinum]
MSVATCAPHAAKGSDPTRSDNPSSTTEWPDKPPLVSKRTRLEGNNNEPRQRLIMRLEPQGVHEHHIEMRVHRGNFFAAWKKLLSWRPMYANSGGPKSSFAPVENSREELYAAKEFRRWPDEAEETHSRLMVAEFCIARELRHPNVVQVLDLLKDETNASAWHGRRIFTESRESAAGAIQAPELYTHDEFDGRAVGIWACGIIYMAMRTGCLLWQKAQSGADEVYAQYLEDRRLEERFALIESLHRARCRTIVYCILDPNPSCRVRASQIFKSDWVREIGLCRGVM